MLEILEGNIPLVAAFKNLPVHSTMRGLGVAIVGEILL